MSIWETTSAYRDTVAKRELGAAWLAESDYCGPSIQECEFCEEDFNEDNDEIQMFYVDAEQTEGFWVCNECTEGGHDLDL